MSDLRWADLSKSAYLATELIKGAMQPGIELNYVIEHPLFQRSPNDTYRYLFIADGAGGLPVDISSLRQAQQTSQSLTSSFHQLAAERKAYAAVAFQYLAEDLVAKATEMNEVLKQSSSFSMTEAERMRLQTFCGGLPAAGQSDAGTLGCAAAGHYVGQTLAATSRPTATATRTDYHRPNQGAGLLNN